MATDKKSFILYCDQKGVWDKLDNEQAGKLIKHIISYVNDDNPEEPDFITGLAFEPIKQHLKRDLKRWETQQDQRSKAGKKSAEVRKRNATSVNERSISSTDNVNVNVTGNVNVTDKEIRELTFREQVAQHTTYDALMLDEFSDYWTESNLKGKKLKFELQKTFDIARRLKKWSSNNFNTSKESTMELPTSYPKNSWE
tara:strand:- start:84 stop:677 length:594 start_codon:yes stop_codon:yes gene_type:complete